MRKDHWVFLILLMAVLALAIWKPGAGYSLQNFLSSSDESESLRIKEATLKARRAIQSDVLGDIPQKENNATNAVVLSRYLFNFKDQLVLEKGEGAGIAVGEPVIYLGTRALKENIKNASSRGVLIGKVISISPRHARVMTIFDPEWQSAVRVGEGGVDALLQGGSEPRITLIPKEEKIAPGDIVYSAGEGAPYGIPLAEVRDVAVSTDGLFQEGRLKLQYEMRDIHVVTVLQIDSLPAR